MVAGLVSGVWDKPQRGQQTPLRLPGLGPVPSQEKLLPAQAEFSGYWLSRALIWVVHRWFRGSRTACQFPVYNSLWGEIPSFPREPKRAHGREQTKHPCSVICPRWAHPHLCLHWPLSCPSP